MKMIINLTILVLLFSCKLKESDEEYKNVLNFFDDEIVSHFPYEVSKGYTLEYDTLGYFNTYSITLTTDLTENLKDKIILNNKLFSIEDSCIIVVNDFIDTDNIINPERYIGISEYDLSCSNFKILPNFWNNDFYDKSTKSKLSKNFEYAIINSKSGVFNKNIRENISFMPNGYNHGYSKGYAIDQLENKIIYWSIIW